MAIKTRQQPMVFLQGVLKGIRIPNLLIIVLSQYFVAIFLVGPAQNWLAFVTDIDLFLLSFSTVLIAAGGYLINDYYDVKIDLINKPRQVIVGKMVKRRVVMLLHSLLNAVAISIGLYLGWRIGLVHLGSAVALWLYSNQLKRLPFIGNFTIGLLTGASVLIVSLFFNHSEVLVFVYGYFAFAWSLIREIIKDLEDWKGDATHGCITLPIVWGMRRTKVFVFVLLSVFIASVIYFIVTIQSSILTMYFLALTPPLIYFIYLLNRADSQRRFHQLSLYCKLIMLSGILSISLF